MGNNFEPWHSRAARAAVDWPAARLEQESGVSRKTISDFEAGKRKMQAANVTAIIAAFERAGVRFDEKGCVCLADGRTIEDPGPDTIAANDLNSSNDE